MLSSRLIRDVIRFKFKPSTTPKKLNFVKQLSHSVNDKPNFASNLRQLSSVLRGRIPSPSQGLNNLPFMTKKRRIVGLIPLELSLSNAAGHLSFLLLAVSYLEKDVMMLRLGAMAGISCALFFQYFRPAPLWIPITWNAAFLVINGVMIALILKERNDAEEITVEEKDVYRDIFLPMGLTPVEFKRLLAEGTRVELPPGETLTMNNVKNDKLALVVQGLVRAEKHGETLAYLSDHQFVGEMGFLSFLHKSDQIADVMAVDWDTATCDTVTETQTLLYLWSYHNLFDVFKHHPEMGRALQSSIAADLMAKLQTSTQLEEDDIATYKSVLQGALDATSYPEAALSDAAVTTTPAALPDTAVSRPPDALLVAATETGSAATTAPSSTERVVATAVPAGATTATPTSSTVVVAPPVADEEEMPPPTSPPSQHTSATVATGSGRVGLLSVRGDGGGAQGGVSGGTPNAAAAASTPFAGVAAIGAGVARVVLGTSERPGVGVSAPAGATAPRVTTDHVDVSRPQKQQQQSLPLRPLQALQPESINEATRREMLKRKSLAKQELVRSRSRGISTTTGAQQTPNGAGSSPSLPATEQPQLQQRQPDEGRGLYHQHQRQQQHDISEGSAERVLPPPHLLSAGQTHLITYRAMLEGSLLDGVIGATARSKLEAYRRRHDVPEAFHSVVLEELGWTLEDFSAGMSAGLRRRGSSSRRS